MLPLFRRKKQWLKWVLLLAIVALAFTTVFLFVSTPTGLTGGIGQQDVAMVAGQTISAIEFRRQYQRLYDLFREAYSGADPQLLEQLNIPQQALNQLINEYAIAYEAEAFGLKVTEEELAQQIIRFPAFQEGGQFIGRDRYRQILQANNMSIRDFESAIRRDILRRKFQRVLTDGIRATPDEVRQAFLEANQEVKVRYMAIDPAAIEIATVAPETLQGYFEENLDRFRIGEKRKIEYVIVSRDPEAVEVSEQQIEAEMAQLAQEGQVRARHILVRSREGDGNETEARQKSQELLRQLRGGADFSALAREHSDDPGSGARGGDLGFFGQGEMVPEFELVAFGLEPGQISDLVRTPYGFHIIQSLEKADATGEGRRTVAEFNARNAEAERQASSLAQQIAEQARSSGELGELASAHGLELRESPFFGEGAEGFGQIPGLPVGTDFLSDVFRRQLGEIEGPYLLGSRQVVARVVDIQPSEIPEFDSVRDEVLELFKEERSSTLARERAEELYREAEQAG
ncbi:MAG TPA: SurA N-terminal domain-containing protein, partial [Acidobacteriota bacterium]|nr:SurA N-terminal domain-containing protein [Acidobacteriota bacterium]